MHGITAFKDIVGVCWLVERLTIWLRSDILWEPCKLSA